MKNRLIRIAAVVAALLVAGFLYNKYRIAPKIKPAALVLTDLTGHPFALDTFKNQKLFISFFATWCGPCLQELPSIFEAQQILEPVNFRFILVSDESIELLQRFNEKTESRFLILHSEKKLHDYNIYTIPTTYLLNTKGEIIFKQTGEEDWASEKMIAKLKGAE